ncbi:SURF1 family protein [Sedimentitalea arenosa]|jgi:surfeit locus 1 family protein|uniref:SURF1-like protein n=1 Tax=Sedimentitalea arenosa TaxID=2798803 RepID=A0A8J7LZK3_9RHOB|nr:SURF1 family protein [Arenibacterium arenosum]MBJ6370991.1 SURF1 family protein [Arenibacterium arenosum]
MRGIFFLLIVGLVGGATLVGLGVWQLQRLAWKEAILADIDARIGAAPVPLPAAPDPVADRYLPVEVSGEIEPGEIQVLVSIKRVGPGLRIIAPFTTEDGRRILLDRGFVEIPEKETERLLGPMTVTGNLHWPQETDSFTPEPDPVSDTWFARDVPMMAASLQTEPVLLVARSRTGPGIRPLPVDSAAVPNDHLQYAITWFSLALIWAGMTVYFLWRGRAGAERES